jgi:nitrile hydratase accessory protein
MNAPTLPLTLDEAHALCANLPIPRQDDELVFQAPWEARVFAMVVNLHKQGRFEWSDWVDHLVGEIDAARAAGALETPYYELWARACEKLLSGKALMDPVALEARVVELAVPVDDHVHPHDHDDDHHHGEHHH